MFLNNKKYSEMSAEERRELNRRTYEKWRLKHPLKGRGRKTDKFEPKETDKSILSNLTDESLVKFASTSLRFLTPEGFFSKKISSGSIQSKIEADFRIKSNYASLEFRTKLQKDSAKRAINSWTQGNVLATWDEDTGLIFGERGDTSKIYTAFRELSRAFITTENTKLCRNIDLLQSPSEFAPNKFFDLTSWVGGSIVNPYGGQSTFPLAAIPKENRREISLEEFKQKRLDPAMSKVRLETILPPGTDQGFYIGAHGKYPAQSEFVTVNVRFKVAKIYECTLPRYIKQQALIHPEKLKQFVVVLEKE